MTSSLRSKQAAPQVLLSQSLLFSSCTVCHHFSVRTTLNSGYLGLHRSIRSLTPALYIFRVDARCSLLHSGAETGFVALQSFRNQHNPSQSTTTAQRGRSSGYRESRCSPGTFRGSSSGPEQEDVGLKMYLRDRSTRIQGRTREYGLGKIYNDPLILAGAQFQRDSDGEGRSLTQDR